MRTLRRTPAWVIAALLLAGCGGGDGGFFADPGAPSGEAPPQPVTGRLPGGTAVEIGVPEGWSFNDTDGHLVVARESGDLDWTEAPTGPRIVVGDGGDPFADILTPEEDGSARSLVVNGAREIEMHGYRGVGVTLEEHTAAGPVTRRYLVLYADASTAELVVLEAPSDEWTATGAGLEGVVATTLRLSPAAGPQAPTTTAAPATTGEPAPTAAPDTVPHDWGVALRDTFDSNENEWPTGDSTTEILTGNRSLVDGTYRMTVVAEQGVFFNSFTDVGLDGDYMVAVEATRLEGAGTTRCGVWVAAESGYPRIGLLVDDLEGEFLLERRDDPEGDLDILVRGPSEDLQVAGANRLTILQQGANLSVFVNDLLVAHTGDAYLTRLGKVGLSTRSPGDGAPSSCEFDNLEITVP